MTVDEPITSPFASQTHREASEALPSSPPAPAAHPETGEIDGNSGEASVGSQGWETEDETMSSIPKAKKIAAKTEMTLPKPRKRVPIGENWGFWEQLAGKKSASASPVPTEAVTPEPALPSAEEPQTSATISYPKL